MKKMRILSLVIVVCMLLNIVITMPVSAAEEGTVSVLATDWQSEGVIFPAQEQVIPAGPIWVKWNTVQNAARYIVYLDDKPGEVVDVTSGNTIEYELYTVDVNTHTVWIEAELINGQKILSKPRTFYVSKKGIGFFNDLSNMQDMNLSWYYTWNTTKSNQAVVSDLDFTPMFWNGQCNPDEIADYKTVLGCNEPDHEGQVNTPATTVARSWWPSFVNSGKRIGSPAAAWEYENKPGQWLYDFMELIKQPDGSYPVDFITIHNYPGWPGDTDGGDQIAGFKALVEDLWNRYHKPIWVTEFAVANWPSNQDDIQSWGYTKQQVYDYMNKILDYLDTCPYVERYAWFSFGDADGNPYGESAGSHAALTNRTTGVLTPLGELYRDKGNPQKRIVSDDAIPGALGGVASCIIKATAGTGGTVTGGGKYNYNSQVTLTANPNEHYLFDGWFEENIKVSDNRTYIFTAIASKTLQARFRVDPSNPPPVPKVHIYDPDNVFGNSAFVYSGIWINQWLEMFGPWPGISLQKNEGWYTFEVDLETIATFILNDGSGDAATQIKYVWDESLHNKTDLYFVVDKDALAYNSDGGSKNHYLTQYNSREAAIKGGRIAPGDAILNIYDPSNQLGNNPYWYGLDVNWWEWPAGSYPGSSLTKSADGWISLQYDLNLLNAIIFNNGTENTKYVWSRDRHKFNEYWLVIDPAAPVHVVDNGSIERYLIPYTTKDAALIGGGTEPEAGRGGPVNPEIPNPDPDPDTPVNTTNIALRKSAITNRPGNGAADLGIDGNANSRFESEHSGNYELTYTIDLGANYSVSKIVINWEAMPTTATKFKIETATSANGPWTEVYTKNSGTAEQNFSTTFNSVTAQYVKLTATEKEGPWGYSFWEFEVYGVPTETVNKNELQNIYNSIVNITNDNYTDATWNEFSTARTQAKAVIDNTSATQAVVDSAKNALQTAISGLIKKEVDPSGDVTNVALGKNASTNRPGNGAADLGIDGNTNSRFESEHGENYELTYTVDLGDNYSISQIAIKWEAMTTTATKFKLEVATSANGPWTEIYSKNNGGAEQNFNIAFNAVTARYVKLTATEKEGPWGYSFWEFEVFGTKVQAPSTNLAKGKTAVTNKPGNGAANNGIDGNSGTRFESEHGGNYELTYTIDLGSTFSVDKTAILWEASTTTATKFKIETATSENGSWTTVYTKDSGDPIMNFEVSFNAINTRYVKLTAYEKTGPWGYSFWEFEVFGR